MSQQHPYDPWPALDYAAFKSSQHLLHMLCQAMGKLKLLTPFEPHWANVALWPTTRGLTTGLIPYQSGAFSVNMDLIHHQVICTNTNGNKEMFSLQTGSVATWIETLFDTLNKVGVKVTINPKPQEIPNPILFHADTEKQNYDAALANAWWRIIISSYRVLQRYHALFAGISPPVGLMWGTFDLRDARYLSQTVPTTGENAGYIRRNAMDNMQVEAGFWSGTELYTKPAYFSFLYPQPPGIESARIKPQEARWDKKMMEFILDYDDVRKSPSPDETLFNFFQSTYREASERAGWSKSLIGAGEPV